MTEACDTQTGPRVESNGVQQADDFDSSAVTETIDKLLDIESRKQNEEDVQVAAKKPQDNMPPSSEQAETNGANLSHEEVIQTETIEELRDQNEQDDRQEELETDPFLGVPEEKQTSQTTEEQGSVADCQAELDSKNLANTVDPIDELVTELLSPRGRDDNEGDCEIIPMEVEITKEANVQEDQELAQEEELEYIVERILDKKIDSRGFAKYLVKWENFPSSANSWEPLENLVDCDKTMQEYERSRAYKLALKKALGDKADKVLQSGKNFPLNRGRKAQTGHKAFEINDIMGLTEANGERYFLISLANSTQKAFIRTSLANQIFPSKVIDYYYKSLRWRTKGLE